MRDAGHLHSSHQDSVRMNILASSLQALGKNKERKKMLAMNINVPSTWRVAKNKLDILKRWLRG